MIGLFLHKKADLPDRYSSSLLRVVKLQDVTTGMVIQADGRSKIKIVFVNGWSNEGPISKMTVLEAAR